MKKNLDELLTINEIVKEQPNLKVGTLQKAYREGKLPGVKIGRSIKITRRNLNKFLGFETTDILLEKDLEISKLRNQLDGYKKQYETLKQLMNTMQNVMSVL